MINEIKKKNVVNLALIVGLIILTMFSVSIITSTSLYPMVVITLLSIIFIISNLKVITNKSLIYIYIFILIVKIGLLLYQIFYKDLPLSGTDWGFYHIFGEELLVRTNGNILDIFFIKEYDLFTKFIAVIYSLFGVNPNQIYFFVFLTSLITFKYIYLLANEVLKDRLKSQKISLLFMIWPIEFIHSITFLREMPIQLLFIISLYYFVRFINFKKKTYFVIALLLIILATMMHSGMIGILISYIFVTSVSNSKSGIDSFNPIKISFFIVVVMLILQSPISEALTAKFGGVDSLDSLVDRRLVSDNSSLNATTNYITTLPDNTLGLLLQLPYLLSMFSLSPFPWQVVNSGTLIAFFIEGLPRIFIVYMLIKYFRKYRPITPKQKQMKTTFLLIIILTYLIFSLGTQSYGTAMRHRAKIFPLEIILVYSALTNRQRKEEYKVNIKVNP